MVLIDVPRREVTIKLVYYGPAMSGKTTNLQQIHAFLGPTTGSELVTLDTRDDRTLFFDLLPVRLEVASRLELKIKLFTVPGQVIHDTTRRVVLQGVDGIAFVADSRISETRNNNESFANLRHNLKENSIAWDDVAVVIQFNKRDLPKIRSDADIDRIAAKGSEPIFKATAMNGIGVLETFVGLARSTWSKIEGRFQMQERFGVTPKDFEQALLSALPSRPWVRGDAA
jgi:signal recognition particle receptor subunit beta